MNCQYDKKSKCSILNIVFINVKTSGDHCKDRCGPNVADKLKMLKRLGYELPAPPENVDLLEWAEKCLADGTAKLPPAFEQQRKNNERRKAERDKQRAELVEIAEKLGLPSPLKQVANFGKHLYEIKAYQIKTGRKYVSDEWRDQRLAICRACPKMLKKREKEYCSLCGCGIKKGIFVFEGKTRYEAMRCELGYWDELDRANGKSV